MVQVVLRESTSTSPDCSAVKRSLADSGTYLTLVESLKMAAATARQISTSIPVQLPLSSGEEKPGRPWLTPQESVPRSLTVLRGWALAAWAARPAARARVKMRGTRFIVKPFEKSPGTLLIVVYAEGPDRMNIAAKAKSDRQLNPHCRLTMDRRSRQAPQLERLNSSAASQNDWRPGSRG